LEAAAATGISPQHKVPPPQLLILSGTIFLSYFINIIKYQFTLAHFQFVSLITKFFQVTFIDIDSFLTGPRPVTF
jgi:hypothetical protein